MENEDWKQKYTDLLNDLKNGTEILDKLEKQNAELKRHNLQLKQEIAMLKNKLRKIKNDTKN